MSIVKRSLTIRGHRTSISIEDAFWLRLQVIARSREMPLAKLVGLVDAERSPTTNLSSALRLFILAEALSRSGMVADRPLSEQLGSATIERQ